MKKIFNIWVMFLLILLFKFIITSFSFGVSDIRFLESFERSVFYLFIVGVSFMFYKRLKK